MYFPQCGLGKYVVTSQKELSEKENISLRQRQVKKVKTQSCEVVCVRVWNEAVQLQDLLCHLHIVLKISKEKL